MFLSTTTRQMMVGITALAVFLSNSSTALCVASSVSWRPALFFGGGGGRRRPFATNQKSSDLLPVVDENNSAVDVRGGGIINRKSPEEQILEHYLSSSSSFSNKKKFHVQGWRWHTMSVIREAERLQKLAQQQQQQTVGDTNADITRLQQAADYVVGFNLKALHRVEKMFFPKMRQWMKDSVAAVEENGGNAASPDVMKAFDKVISDLEQDQKKMAELGKKISLSLSSSSTKSSSNKSNDVARMVADQSGELVSLAKSMLDREIHLIMPTVARCVPEKEQKKFNNQVIKFLGVLESRVHLVHMHEVVTEANSKAEQKLWEESIPSLPRSMIPRWKRTLYEPKAAALVMP